MKTCIKCQEAKPLSEFAWKSKEKGTRQGACKACQRLYSRQHYKDNTEKYKGKSKKYMPTIHARNKAWLKQYLLAHPCACGESDIEVLQFDHVVPLENFKAPRVGAFLHSSLARLQEEVEKCVVRCANCHYRLTRKQMGWSWD